MKHIYSFFVFVLLLTSCSRTGLITKTPDKKPATTVYTPTVNNSIGELTPTNVRRQTTTIEPRDYYADAFVKLQAMLNGQRTTSFKDAVFITENAWYENSLSYDNYNNSIKRLVAICKAYKKANLLKGYKESDSLQVELSGAIYKTMTDSLKDNTGRVVSIPYSYNFNDAFADKYWPDRFVTSMLSTHTGNCHSLPFLYKIVAEELHIPAYMSFLPEHIYIRQYSKQYNWFNTELTSRTFPVDAWLMTSGYVSTESIISKIYMDTLGLKQSIAVCVNDLATGYVREFGNKDGVSSIEDLKFVLSCCELGLTYYPNYAELLLLKAETLKKLYLAGKTNGNEMEQTYAKLTALDYREIPDGMYYRWMGTLVKGDSIWNRKADSLIKPVNPFASIGQQPKGYLTLSKGYYDENFLNDTLRRIGSVVFNTVTNKVEHYIQRDEPKYSKQLERPKEDSRFLSIDPMASIYPSNSPYSALGCNPLVFIDETGETLTVANAALYEKYKSVIKVAFASKVEAQIEDGVVTLHQIPNTTLTEHEQNALEYLNQVINDRSITVPFNLVDNSTLNTFFIGNYATGELNVDHLLAIGNDDNRITTRGLLVHETMEQYEKQKRIASGGGQGDQFYDKDHLAATHDENYTQSFIRDDRENTGYVEHKNGSDENFQYIQTYNQNKMFSGFKYNKLNGDKKTDITPAKPSEDNKKDNQPVHNGGPQF